MEIKNVLEKVRGLMEERGVKKIRLGEVLGVKKSASQQAKYQKASRFLGGKQEQISVMDLERVAKFFEKDLSYFLNEGVSYGVMRRRVRVVAQEGKGYESWSEMAKYLREVRGLEEREVEVVREMIDLLAKEK